MSETIIDTGAQDLAGFDPADVEALSESLDQTAAEFLLGQTADVPWDSKAGYTGGTDTGGDE